jgi:hypothetical protein
MTMQPTLQHDSPATLLHPAPACQMIAAPAYFATI